MSEVVELYKQIDGRIYVLEEYALRPITIAELKKNGMQGLAATHASIAVARILEARAALKEAQSK